MKRLIIIVEGDTEEEFVNSILRPYFYSKGFYQIDCFKIKHSKGGMSKYRHLKKDILNIIYENNVVVSTLIDFYALPTDFPKFEDSKQIQNKSDRITFLENAIQHEFEALIFSSIKGIEELFEKSEANFKEIEKIIQAYPNPEDINDNPNTAPSKRLIQNIKGYNKVIDGVSIIEEIGLPEILNKCSRFRNWIEILEDALGE